MTLIKRDKVKILCNGGTIVERSKYFFNLLIKNIFKYHVYLCGFCDLKTFLIDKQALLFSQTNMMFIYIVYIYRMHTHLLHVNNLIFIFFFIFFLLQLKLHSATKCLQNA